MTPKQLRNKLAKIINDSGEFETYDNRDPCFVRNLDNELVVVGDTEEDTFALKIIKVD